ncbi:MAG: hypothetical protein HC792_02580 [Acaryochloridaceae cyanobacterium CSU_5_19]|nr:hypothetical protein [Acaryochloridaceae cyanobacterium CSU_5_19]
MFDPAPGGIAKTHSGEATLQDLSVLILSCVSLDSGHLDVFTYTNERGRKGEVIHPYTEGDHFTGEVKI